MKIDTMVRDTTNHMKLSHIIHGYHPANANTIAQHPPMGTNIPTFFLPSIQ